MRNIFFLLFFLLGSGAGMARLQVSSLRVEHMENPSVLDEGTPRFSWINLPSSPSARGEKQKAWRIQVATSREDLLKGRCDAWDSGKREGESSVLIPYEGRLLSSGRDYWFRIMVWNQKGQPSSWSEPGRWGMGLLNPEEWKGKWISASWDKTAPLFRKTFTVHKKVRQAKMFISGLGYFELYMNGNRVGDDYLVPNFTNYTTRDDLNRRNIAFEPHFRDYRVLYLSYDVTDNLRNGKNAIGVILGDGFYQCVSNWVSSFGKPTLLCQLMITYEDGTSEIVPSDTTWKTKRSAIKENGPYVGELYDSRDEDSFWGDPGMDDKKWENALLAISPVGKLTAQASPSDKITEIIRPVSLRKVDDGIFEVDFGKEVSGWIRFLGVKGKKGDILSVKYVCESPLGKQQYVFKDSNPVSYAPRFTWYVFSKAVISGVSSLAADQLQAEAVNTDVPVSAEFECDNPLFNRIVDIWQRSQLDNMHGCIASDCPHRERSPYTGDGQAVCSMVMSNFDAAAFYQKWIRDIRDVQDTMTGYVPNAAPWQPGCGGGVAWGAAMNIMPWEFYLHYGDIRMLRDSYVAMKMHLDDMLQWLTPDSTMWQQKSNVGETKPNRWFNLGDWAPAYKVPSDELVHTFYLWLCLDNTARTAQVLQRNVEAEHYFHLAERIKKAFHRKFYDSKLKSYGDYGSNVFALRMGVPAECKAGVVETLRKEIKDKYKGHINTGFLAARYFFEVLAENGLADVAYSALNKTDFPSFGYWIAQGATVTWEQWDGRDSHNHPMFGGGLVWLYRDLAGVRLDEAQPGYKHFYVNPVLLDSIKDVKYRIQSPYGEVSSEISCDSLSVTYNIGIPVGSTASVFFPVRKEKMVTEEGRSLRKRGLKPYKFTENGFWIDVPQGKYTFRIRRP